MNEGFRVRYGDQSDHRRKMVEIDVPSVDSDNRDALRVSGGSGKLSVSAGGYKIGADGDFQLLPKTNSTTGSFAYLKISYANFSSPTVSVVISSTVLESVILSQSEPYPATESNVLLGYLDEESLVRVMSGNMMITVWAINGVAAYWADSMGGERSNNA